MEGICTGAKWWAEGQGALSPRVLWTLNQGLLLLALLHFLPPWSLISHPLNSYVYPPRPVFPPLLSSFFLSVSSAVISHLGCHDGPSPF